MLYLHVLDFPLLHFGPFLSDKSLLMLSLFSSWLQSQQIQFVTIHVQVPLPLTLFQEFTPSYYLLKTQWRVGPIYQLSSDMLFWKTVSFKMSLAH